MTSGNNKLSARQILGYIFTLGLTVFLLYITFRNVDFSTVEKNITNISFFWLLPFLATFLISHLLRALRWKVMIYSVKKDASILNLMTSTIIGYGVNCIVPRLGEVYRGMFLGKLENISRTSMFGTIIVERVIDILTLGLSVLVSVLIYPGNLYEEFVWLKSALIIGFIGIGVIIVFLVLIVRMKEKFYKIILRILSKFSEKISDKMAYIFQMITDGFSTINSVSILFKTILLSILIMLVYGLSSYLAFLTLRMDEVHLVTYGMAWILMTISAFGIVIPTPGGTGSYHLITLTVLTELFGFSQASASAYAIFTHFISYVVFVGSPFIFIVWVNKRRLANGASKVNFINVLKSVGDDK